MKRKAGEGSWGKKNIKGVEYHYFRDVAGKYTYAKTMKELKLKLEKNKTQIVHEKSTFLDYANYWLRVVKIMQLEARSYDDYEDIINSRISKYDIADMQLTAINTDHWRLFLKELAEKYSLATIQKTWNVCRQVVNYAEEEDKIPPGTIKNIKMPKGSKVAVQKKEVPFVSESDMEILYQEAYKQIGPNNKYVYGDAARIVVLIMYTGMRVSEACALTWGNVDFENYTITVKNSLSKVKERDSEHNVIKQDNGNNKRVVIKKDPKSKDSKRTIPLPNRAIEVLEYFEKENPKHKKSDFVCMTSEKKPYDKDQVRKTLHRMQNNSNCSRKDYSPHCLRHGYGSVLISKGADIKLVSELLGHSDVAFTYNVYIGIFEEDKRKAVNLFDEKKGGSPSTQLKLPKTNF